MNESRSRRGSAGWVVALVASTMSLLAVSLATYAASAAGGDAASKTSPVTKPGLYWDMRTQGIADVQRFKDTNGVVCYVAKNPISDSDSPSISCVKP